MVDFHDLGSSGAYIALQVPRSWGSRLPGSVSVHTVNTHVRSIYAKRQVRDRTSAVQRARQARLLAAGRTR